MAILSIDSYLQSNINSYIDKLLTSSYIIREVVLADFDEDIRDSFIKTFCRDSDNKGTEIPVTFTFPESKQDKQAFILIQYKGGEESESDLGSITGVSRESTETEETIETLEVHVEKRDQGKVCYLEPTKHVADVETIYNFAGSYRVADGRVYLESPVLEQYLELGEPISFKIMYTAYTEDIDYSYQGQPYKIDYGYNLLETFTIDSVSNNMDTLRCLDALLRTVLIYMRSTPHEQIEYRLAHLVFMGSDLIQEINTPTNSIKGEQLFYRRAEISYDSTYSIQVSKGSNIKDADIRVFLDKEG